ncbi:hypothetical protein B0H12DRAFT_1229995 [Mycena haematopus]|nr:hypothetical protein B0H12DRAFT_1229995 [Mycena haematopus]
MSKSTRSPAFPPELIDAIICEIDDVESLKACSVVASSLRSRSQRILFSALTVKAENYAAVFKLLTESPHIADYITNLIIMTLQHAVTCSDIFCQILAKLQNVRRCTLDGVRGRIRMHCARGRRIVPPLLIPPPVFDFLVRQPLRELSLICINLKTYVGQHLVRPRYIPYLAALRHLSFRSPGDEGSRELIEVASRTLEHIYFDCSEHPPLNLPHLPALRTLQLTFFVQELFTSPANITMGRPEIISRAADILSSLVVPQVLPALADIKIEQHFAEDGVFDPAPYGSLMALLDGALAAYPTAPSIHWFLLMNDNETL